MALPEIIITADGSHSLLDRQRNETYHSVHGALQESRHVFIRNGLEYWFQNNEGEAVVFEVGFGTALNALLALQSAERDLRKVRFQTIEAFPLPQEIWSQLNYASTPEERDQFDSLHLADWEKVHQLSDHFSLMKSRRLLQEANLQPQSFDVIFFDAFAPAKQPEMWTYQMLEKVCAALRPKGVFVTYCAMGQLKRDLRAVGLTVETLPGPPGKKEMVRAQR